jgi:hypothetical protein
MEIEIWHLVLGSLLNLVILMFIVGASYDEYDVPLFARIMIIVFAIIPWALTVILSTAIVSLAVFSALFFIFRWVIYGPTRQ